MKVIKLYRHWQDENQTFGNLVVFDEQGKPIFSCSTIERGWRNNQSNVSCVPVGEYPLVWEHSPRFKQHLWELKNVPARSECKIHPANSWHQLNGCISLGIKLKDIDSDGYIDVTMSRPTMDQFHQCMKYEVNSVIKIKNSFD
tara:strand:+ start:30413 stop:30841 length:429 start_codon:yes stop_codon:yes gene_type:complete